MNSIPVCDPSAGILSRRDAIEAALRRVLESNRYILGPEVEAFEAEFAAWCGLRHTVGVANGMDALVLALRVLDIGPGDTVLTVSMTATATVAAVRAVGATPVLVDVHPDSALMDPQRVAEALARWPARLPLPRVILPVHLYGQPCAMDELAQIAAGCGATLLEDCAQAHGAAYDGRRVGGFGRLAAFSFYPTKNLGAVGDGGAVLTNDDALAARLRRLRQYGWSAPQWAEEAGMNSRLDELQAAILRVRLPALEVDNARRRMLAAIYDTRLAALPTASLRRLPPDKRAQPVYHQYVCQTPERETLRTWLSGHGISTGVHYPHPVHLQPGYRDAVQIAVGGLTETERIARETLSLPMYPELPPEAAERVAQAVCDFFARG